MTGALIIVLDSKYQFLTGRSSASTSPVNLNSEPGSPPQKPIQSTQEFEIQTCRFTVFLASMTVIIRNFENRTMHGFLQDAFV